MTIAFLQAYRLQFAVAGRGHLSATYTSSSVKPGGGGQFETSPCWVPSMDKCESPLPYSHEPSSSTGSSSPGFMRQKFETCPRWGANSLAQARGVVAEELFSHYGQRHGARQCYIVRSKEIQEIST